TGQRVPRRGKASSDRKVPSRTDDELVPYGQNSGRSPCGLLGLIPLGPRAHFAAQRDLAPMSVHLDLLRIDDGAAPEGILDLVLDLARGEARRQTDGIAH